MNNSTSYCSPQDAENNYIEFKNSNSKFRQKKERSTLHINPSQVNGEDNINTDSELTDSKSSKEIGRWGEEYVYERLKEEFAGEEYEIFDLNDENTRGIGCDFEVKKNGELFKLIEVKSNENNPFEVSSKQWEDACTYENKYRIYCVFNACKKNAKWVKIQNPYNKWKNGELKAYPVNIVVG